MKLTVKFSKKGDMKYVSHLDLMRLFQRASRRADIPVAISQGFSPRPKISIFPAIKLGLESENLEAVFVIAKEIESESFKRDLQGQLPEGITILGVHPALPK